MEEDEEFSDNEKPATFDDEFTARAREFDEQCDMDDLEDSIDEIAEGSGSTGNVKVSPPPQVMA